MRLWLNKDLKLFRLDVEYCRDLRASTGVAETSDSQMLVWSDCDVRDLLIAGSWEVAPGMSRCGRDGGGVVPVVGGALCCTNGGVVPVPTGGVATVVVRVGVWAVADTGLGVCGDVGDVSDVGDEGDVENSSDLAGENCWDFVTVTGCSLVCILVTASSCWSTLPDIALALEMESW